MKRAIHLAATCSILAFAFACGSAEAQTDPAAPPATVSTSATAPQVDIPSGQTEESADKAAGDIVVTGSRLVTNGYSSPTPVTVVGSDELKNAAPSMTEALRELPALTGSTSPSTPSFTPQGNVASTSDQANLRNLGATRTLVLLDGRRPPASGVTGTADISLFPLQLVKRVDIVTGGASAAYGSDAVSGVVNFILDTDFKGLTGEARSGVSTYGDDRSYAFQLSGGIGFAGDRGHLIVSANVSGQTGVDGYDRPYSFDWWSAVPNPNSSMAGQPQLLLRQNVNLSGASFGGLIITPGPLANIQFDANGNPQPYHHGSLNSGTIEVGGDGARYLTGYVSATRNRSVFAHTKFDISDSFSIFAEGSYGYSQSDYPNLAPYNLAGGAYTVNVDNAYLPASVRALMVANGLTSFQLGKIDLNVGRYHAYNTSKTLNLTTGFNAKVAGFSIDGYYEHGDSRLLIYNSGTRYTARSLLASDAVVSPVSGAIVCRSTLTDPTNGCVPFNVFGTQTLRSDQLAYQYGNSFAKSVAKQDVAALNARGNLFRTWAGNVSAAIGAEYRAYTGAITNDPTSQSLGWTAGNVQASAGSLNVKEAYSEVLVPLAAGKTFLKSLDLDGAFRITDYSTSGSVHTWKVGLNSEIVSGLRLRGTYSQDIRAPNIGDLFGPRTRNSTTVRDPFLDNVLTSNVIIGTGSNPDLLPERARTLTVGGSYRPVWLRWCRFSGQEAKLSLT